MVNSVSSDLLSSVNGSQAAAAKGNGTSAKEMEDQFLTLLLTQLQNQDPTSPMENAELTSQLAQMSTVSGVEKMNDTMNNMMAQYQTSQIVSASNMIGRGVLSNGNEVALSSYELANGDIAKQAIVGVDLAGSADSVMVSIFNASGTEVYKMDLGEHSSGILPVYWDGASFTGPAPDGRYTFSVAATNGGEKVESRTLSYNKVGSVNTSAEGVLLNLGDFGKIKVGDVVQVF